MLRGLGGGRQFLRLGDLLLGHQGFQARDGRGRGGIVMRGADQAPLVGFDIVFGHAFAVFVHRAEVERAMGQIPALDPGPEPPERLGAVLGKSAESHAVEVAQPVAHAGVAARVGQAPEPSGLGVILLDAPAQEVEGGQAAAAAGIAVVGGAPPPLGRFRQVRLDAPAVEIEPAQLGLGVGIAFFRGLAQPLGGLGVILRDAPAVLVKPPQRLLGVPASLVGGEAIEPGRLGVVPLDARPDLVKVAQPELGELVALVGRRPVPFRRLRVVRFYAPAVLVKRAQAPLRPLVALGRGLAVPPGRLDVVLLESAPAVLMEPRERVLAGRVAPLGHDLGPGGRFFQPLPGLGVILGDLVADGVEIAEQLLGREIAGLRRRAGLRLGPGRGFI